MTERAEYIVGIDLGNSNCAFCINHKAPDGSIKVRCFSAASGKETMEKYSSDLFYHTDKSSRIINPTTKNTSFYSELDYDNCNDSTKIIISGFKSKLYERTGQFFCGKDILKEKVKCNIGEYTYELDKIFAICYELILQSVIMVLKKEYNFDVKQSLKFVLTIPELATEDESIYTHKCFIQAYEQERKDNMDISELQIKQYEVITVSESISCYFEVLSENMLAISEQTRAVILDLGSSTIDISVFKIMADKLPNILYGNAILGAGNELNAELIELLQEQFNIKDDLTKFIKDIETRGIGYCDNGIFTYDLSSYEFNVARAQEKIEDNDNLCLDENKLLEVDEEFFEQTIQASLAKILEIMAKIQAEYGAPQYIILTGGFSNYRGISDELCMELNTKDTQVFKARNSSISVCLGSTRIYDYELECQFRHDLILQVGNKEEVVVSAYDEVINEVKIIKEFDIESDSNVIQIKLLYGTEISVTILEKPRYVLFIEFLIYILPESSMPELFYFWKYDQKTEEINEILGENSELSISRLEIHHLVENRTATEEDKAMAEDIENLLWNNDSLPEILAVIIIRFPFFFCNSGVIDQERYSCNMHDYVEQIIELLSLRLEDIEHYCFVNYVELELASELLTCVKQLLPDYKVWLLNPKLKHEVVDYIIRKREGLPMDFGTFLELNSSSTCLFSELTKVYELEHIMLIFSEEEQAEKMCITLSKAFASPICEVLIHVILLYHFKQNSNYKIELLNIKETIQLIVYANIDVSFCLLQKIEEDFKQIGKIAGLVGKFIITMSEKSYFDENENEPDCILRLSSFGANRVEGEALLSINARHYYEITRNNLLKLSERYESMSRDETDLAIGLSCDLMRPVENVIISNGVFCMIKNVIVPQIIIYSKVEELEEELWKTAKTAQWEFRIQQVHNMFNDTVGGEKSWDPNEENDFYEHAVCYIDNNDKQYMMGVSKSASEEAVGQKLKEFEMSQTIELPVPQNTSMDAYCSYPICECGQLFVSCSAWTKLFLKMAKDYLYKSKEFRHCSFDHVYGEKYHGDVNSFTNKCPRCGACFCIECNTWHIDEGERCMEEEGIKQCKKCGRMYEKIRGCNHIFCPCGAHNCFICGETFTTAAYCYEHLIDKHEKID